MAKLVTLKLDGDFEEGFRVTLEIGSEGEGPETELTGRLPPAPNLVNHYHEWRSTYRSLGSSLRAIKIKRVAIGGSINNQSQGLCDRLNRWLKSELFSPLREKWLEKVGTTEEVRVLIRTKNPQLRQLPWHQWDFLERYHQAEIALSTPEYEQPGKSNQSRDRHKVRILAILGNSEGINIQQDRQLLENLPFADITFLVEEPRQKLNEALWEQPWDILFFAGHSETEAGRGRIHINQTDSLTIDELREALKKAIERGLSLAIFNSCDGLGLANELEQLHIPHMIIMREPVPDLVAQQFLQYFLKAFASGKSLYLAVQEARKKLQGLEDQCPCASWLPVICQNPAAIPPTWQQLRGNHQRHLLQSALIVSVVVTILVMVIRQLGMLQLWELKAFDQLMRLRPNPGVDTRLLVVEATDAEIMRYGYPLPDQTLAQVLDKLESDQPRMIGLDIFRERPREPGHQALSRQLQQNQKFIALCSAREANNPKNSGIKPPSGVPESRLGFSNIMADPDGIIRRHLVFMHPYHDDPCATDHSFSARVALHYLAQDRIKAKTIAMNKIRLGKTVLTELSANAGGYHNRDYRGFQVLLNYRKTVARRVTVTEVLEGKVKPEWVKDKIVLIGITARIAKDYHLTPYSALEWPYQEMPGVILQAQMVSQMISAGLGERPLLSVWSVWGDLFWVWAWSIIGATIAWRYGRILYWGLATVTATGVLYLLCFGLFTLGVWVPLVPSALALVATSVIVVVYRKPLGGITPLALDGIIIGFLYR
ncbi:MULTISPECIES: CHASE2 domain-containing protein [unclassified Moorena]|uniref:CHASE2 domain-containing protein n=1 Tax=unclassified Moorena TaxID=2683338 RepID=UPI0013BB0875|nr:MULTISPECIES: CHASE2 domain-containing protein [unclassified Moorena]NEQ08140.1 CHASE2 domain-containing protein [Moorena sp. SIO4E2]NER91254.1 CHASE2 domain-containing protein [Moorena sp. SIO3A2]